MTWERRVNKPTAPLGKIIASPLLGYRPKDPPTIWVETLKNMTASRIATSSLIRLIENCAFAQLDPIPSVG